METLLDSCPGVMKLTEIFTPDVRPPWKKDLSQQDIEKGLIDEFRTNKK